MKKSAAASVLQGTRSGTGHHPITGCLAASVTPLDQDGEHLDEAAFEPLTNFMAASGLDGFLVMGTTGEGVLLNLQERKRVIDLFVKAARARLKVVVHAGAQTTRDTAAIAEHAAHSGADAVAVIGPPYFALDDRSILDHFKTAGRACAPLPFYVYEFAARSGYAISLAVITDLRDQLPNFAGLKVSDTPWERVEPYLLEGLSIFIGSESLIHRGMANGAVGAVSALASALPELVLNAVKTGSQEATQRCANARDRIQAFPFHSALKTILGQRGVALTNGVRAPLRRLSLEEQSAFYPIAEDLVRNAAEAASSRS